MALDTYFDKFIDDLIAYAKQQGDALSLKDHKNTTWCKFTNQAVNFNPTDIPSLGKAFSRNEEGGLNDQYISAMLNGASFAEIIAINTQGDYMAAMERAYRLRHAGKIRRQAWSAARLTGHGKSKSEGTEDVASKVSGIFDRVRQQVNQAIKSGEVEDNPNLPKKDKKDATGDVVTRQLELMGRSTEDEEVDLLGYSGE